jgi:2-hydroxyglutaryl-CoA dehydratase, D-component
MNNGKDRTVFNNWRVTKDLANFILDQDGLSSLDDWGGKEVVREILPENMKTVFDKVQPDLIDCILQDRNRRVASAFLNNLVGFVDYCEKLLDDNRPICYHYFPISVEILLALGVAPVCYEVICGVDAALYIDGSEAGIDRIEAEGYPDHLCSTQKGTAGYFLMDTIPKPDFLVKSATPCDSSNKLYEWTAVKFDAPLIMLETPYYRNERGHQFAIGEVKRMIRELEKLTGTKLDEDRLREYCDYGNETVDYILKIQELKRKKPCPDTGWHRPADTIFMTQIGTPFGRDYFKTLYETIKERVDAGVGIIPEDKEERRLAWGYTWEVFDLPFFDWLEQEHGATYSLDTLTYLSPETGLVDTTNMETMIEGLSWRLLNMPMGRQTMGFSDVWINDFVKIAKEYKIDAFVIGGHMACKHFWALNKLLTDKIKDEVGIPTLRFEMDMFDKRFTPPNELKRIMTEFFATM